MNHLEALSFRYDNCTVMTHNGGRVAPIGELIVTSNLAPEDERALDRQVRIFV